MEKFAIGLLVGGIAGALITANNYKMRMLVKKGQEEVQAKLDQFMDEKIDYLQKGTDKIKDTVKEKAEDVLDKAEDALDSATQTRKVSTRGTTAKPRTKTTKPATT